MQNNIKYITYKDIENLNITPEMCNQWAKEVILRKNECILPPKISIKPVNDNFFTTMPSYIPFIERIGIKEVSRIVGRDPALKADILLYNSKSGELLSFMDGTWITSMRTGAVAAITIEKLKKSTTKSYSFIGLGNTAKATLLCLNSILNGQEITIKLFAYKKQHLDFMESFSRYQNIKFFVYNDLIDFFSNSDVIVSCITSTQSLFADEKVYPKGILIVPVHTRGFQNCDLFFDKIFCDDIGHIRNFQYFNEYKSVSEMTDVLNNETIGRENDEQRILAYNIGISIQDIFFASKIYDMFNKNLLNLH